MKIIKLQGRGDVLKKIHSFLSFFILICIFTNACYAQGISWYCKRESNHKQPSLGSDLSFCEGYDVYWCDKNHSDINDSEKVIYLTFDAGYENGNVEKIVDILNDEGVNGAFFILDNLIIKNKALVQKMIDSGHIVANHTLKHKDMTTIKNIEEFKNELESLEKLYYDNFGVKMPRFYRPPEGKFNKNNLIWAKELGYKTVMWSFAYADWDNGKQPSSEYAMKKILDNLHNGEVMLLHPTSATNATIMKELIVELKGRGYRFATVEELCES
jgi:peptidoglycan-N-acetylmuramic acid deacetylase